MKNIFYKMLITALITAVPLVLLSQTIPDSTTIASTVFSVTTDHADSTALSAKPDHPASTGLTTEPDRCASTDSSASQQHAASYEIRITPLVRTLQVNEISSNSASITNTVISLFNLTVFARGVCWSTSENPTIAGRVTIDGHGAGAFTSRLIGLTPNTTYYMRAYAVNSEGFAYGQQVAFITPEPVPTPKQEPEQEPKQEPEQEPEPAQIQDPRLQQERKSRPDDGAVVPLPDEGFKSYCLQWFDTNRDHQISVEEAAAVTEIKCPFYNIKSLQGIEYFTSLQNLSCSDNDMTTLDVSQNTELVYLNCSNNRLSQIDISSNRALLDLNCTGNRLTTLDMTANTALQTLFCGYNQLTALDLSHNDELLWVICDCNQLLTMDVSSNPNILRLECVNNLITSLNVNGAISLMSLDCSRNHLACIDISGAPALTSLVCMENNLATLDAGFNTALTQLFCTNNALLREIRLNPGQVIEDLRKDPQTVIQYK